jgi:hypothetical protein
MLGGVGLQAAHDPLGSPVDRDTLHPQRELLYRLEQCRVMALRVLRPRVLADQRGPVLQRCDLPLHPSGDEVQTRQPPRSSAPEAAPSAGAPWASRRRAAVITHKYRG